MVAVIVGAFLCSLTYRKEYQFRYHLDTLRKERFVTTRILGIPVSRRDVRAGDQYGDTYAQITGGQPADTRWMVMPPDYIEGLNGGFRCHNYGFEFHTRRQLLSKVFDRFKSGMPRDTATELIKRIDVVVPVQPGNQTINFEDVDEIRAELGLETRSKRPTAEQAAPSNGDKPSN